MEVQATYKAVANFASLNRAARKARRNLEELREEAVKTQAVLATTGDGAGKGFKTAKRDVDSFGDTLDETGDSAEQLSLNLDAVVSKTVEFGDAAKKAGKDTDALDKGARKTGAAVDDLGDAADRAKTSTTGLGDAMGQTAAKSKAATTNFERQRRAYLGLGRDADDAGGKIRGLRAAFDAAGGGARALSGVLGMLKFPAIAVGANALVGALNALAAGAAAAVGALGPLLGIAGALPGLLGAAGAGIGTLFLGFRGLGDAMSELEKAEKKAADTSAKAASSRVSNARAIERAERGVVRAERRVVQSQEALLEAQEAVNEARDEAVRNLLRLRNQLENDALAEEDAAIRIMEAQQDLTDTIQDQNSTYADVVRAEFEIRRAEQDLEDAQAQRKDTAEELADAEEKGVDRADVVVEAQERLADATWNAEEAQIGLQDAMYAVEEAARSAAEAQNAATASATEMAEAYNKLGPNAKAFVDTLRRAKQVMEDISGAVQESLLPGVQVALEALLGLAQRLEDEFVSLAGVFSGQFIEVGGLVGEEEFGDDVESLFGMTEQMVEPIFNTIQSLVRGFTDVAVAAQEMVLWIVSLVEQAASAFERWAEAGRKSGELQESFRETMEAFEQWGRILFDLGGGLRDIFRIGEEVLGFTDALEQLTAKFYGWTNSIRGQNEIRDYFEAAKEPLAAMLGLIGDIIRMIGRLGEQEGIAPLINQLRDEFLPALEGLLEGVTESLGPALIDLLTNITELMSVVFGEEGGGGFTAFVETLNTFLEAILKITEHVPGASEALSGLFIALGASKGIKTIGGMTGVSGVLKRVGKANRLSNAATAAGVAAPGMAGVIQRSKGKVKGGKAAKVLGKAKGGLVKAGGALAAFATGPVGIAIAAIAAIGAGLYALYKNHEGFRQFIDKAWQGFLAVVRTVWAAIRPIIVAIGEFVVRMWQEYVWPTLQVLGEVWRAVFGAVIAVVRGWWKVVSQILGLLWDIFKVTVLPILKLFWKMATIYFEAVAAVIGWFWRNIVQPVLSRLIEFFANNVIPAIQRFADVASSVFDNVAGFIESMRDRFQDALGTIRRGFESFKSFLGRVWEIAVNLVSKPVGFLINDILDGMILANLQRVVNFLGLDLEVPRISFTAPTFSQPIPSAGGVQNTGRFNKGGRVPGRGPNRDTVPAMLTPGEFVIRRDAVQKIGLRRLQMLNNGYNEGGEVTEGGGFWSDPLGSTREGIADLWQGGKNLLSGGIDLARHGAAKAFDLAMSPLTGMLGRLPLGGFGDILRGVANTMVGHVSSWIRGKEAEFGGGNLQGGEFARTGVWPPKFFGSLASNTAAAAAFVRSQFGVNDIGTLGSRPNKSDHPYGKALDAMVYDNTALGTRIAKWFVQNPHEFGTKYVVWHDQINTGSGWRKYTHPNGPTDNPTLRHLDHVHVSFLNRGGPVQRLNGGGLVGGARFGGGLSSARSLMGSTPRAGGISVRASSALQGGSSVHIENLNVINPVPTDVGGSLVRGMRRSQQLLDSGRRR